MHMCVFPFRKHVFAGNGSAQGPVGVWSLHVHEVRPAAIKPAVTFLQVSVVMLITDWVSEGGHVFVKGHLT